MKNSISGSGNNKSIGEYEIYCILLVSAVMKNKAR